VGGALEFEAVLHSEGSLNRSPAEKLFNIAHLEELFLRHANWRGACHQRPVPRTSRLGASSATVFFRTIAGATLAVALAAAIELFLILLLPCVAAPVLAAAAGELLPILVISLGIAWLAADARFLARLVFGIPVHRRIPQHLLFESTCYPSRRLNGWIWQEVPVCGGS
jgi:hypothetical protein